MKSALNLCRVGANKGQTDQLARYARQFNGAGRIPINRQWQSERRHPNCCAVLSSVYTYGSTIKHLQGSLSLQACLVQVTSTRNQKQPALQPYLTQKKVEAEIAIDSWLRCALRTLTCYQLLPGGI
jgi:hypothetical protein